MGGALASMGKFKLGVIAAGVAVVALGVKLGITAVKAAASFEQGMARVRAVTGAVGEAFAALEKEAKRLGKVTKFTMVEIASGMETLGRAGFDTMELVGAMGGVTALASSQMMSLAEAGEITANILRAMQIPAKDANRVVNMLAAAAASSNTTVQSLGESFKMIAPLAAALGTPVEELGSIIGKLGDVGFRGTMATSTLATALSRLAAPPAEATRALEELGMSIWDAQGEFIGFTEMIRELEERFVGLTTQQKQAYLGMIFGRRAIKQITALIGVGADTLEKYTESITGTNAAFEQQRIMLDTLSGRWVILKSSVDLLFMTLGTPSLDTMSNLTTVITDVVNTITEWKESTQLVTDAVSEMGDEAEGSEKKIISLSDRILDLTGGLVNLKGVVYGVMNAIRFIWDLTFGAIVAALKIVMNYLLTLIRLLQGDWKGVWEAQKRMFQSFADYFLTIFRDLGISFKDFIDDIKSWWSGMWLGLKRDMTSFVNFFIAQINKIISLINMIPLLPDVTRMELLVPPTAPPEPGRGVAGMLEAGRAATQALRAAREAVRAAKAPVEEIATCVGDVCTVTEELTDEMSTCADVVESVVEKLSAFELALLAITVADVINAPAKMAAELKKLGEEDIVAAAVRTQELIRTMEAEIDALVLFGMETEKMEGYLKAFQDALSGPVSALEMVKWADVLAAPVETAEKLAQLAAEDAVAVAEYTRELIGVIETEIDARRMFGMETEETEEALALFRETIAAVTEEGIKLSDLWSPLKNVLGELTGLAGQLATGAVDLVRSFVEGGFSITNVTSAITFVVRMLLGFIRKAITDLEEEIRGLEEQISELEEQQRQLEGVLAFYISSFEKAASVMNNLLGVLGPLGSIIGATVSAFTSSIRMLTLEGIDLLNAGIDMLTNYLNSLISTVLGLIQKSDAYQAVQEQGSRAWKAISDLFGQFLWPLAALLKHIMDWLGIQEKVKEAAAVEIGVPSAWKRARRAYEAAAPGMPFVEPTAGIEIPAWATAIVEGIAEAIEGVLKKFGISSWTDLLEAFKAGSIKFWGYIETKIPELVSALTSIFNTISDALGGGVVDTIVGWLKKGFDWLIKEAPAAVAKFIEFNKMIWDLIGFVWNWFKKQDWTQIWKDIKEKFKEFKTTLEDLLDFTDTISAIDAIGLKIDGLTAEIATLGEKIEDLKTRMSLVIMTAAGLITGAIIGAAGILSPAALAGALAGGAGALAGAAAAGFLDWPGKGGMEWVGTGGGEGYWKAPSFQLGGIVPGPIGAPRLARVEGGEEVLTYAQRNRQQPIQVFNETHVYLGQDELADFVIERVQYKNKLLTGSRSTTAAFTRRAYA